MLHELEAALKAAGDPTRSRILKLLEAGPLCVCQVQAVLRLAPSTVSKHLALLRAAGLVSDEREGRWIRYGLATGERNPYASEVLALLRGALDQEPRILEDRRRLREVSMISLEELCALPPRERLPYTAKPTRAPTRSTPAGREAADRTRSPRPRAARDGPVRGTARRAQAAGGSPGPGPGTRGTTREPGARSTPPRPRLLFVCVENSCRSQMAEGFARALGAGQVEAHSAGSRPSGQVHPGAARFMAEKDVDLSTQRSKGLGDLPAGVTWDWIVTMGCGDACPHLPARHRIDWDLPDPKHLDDAGFRAVRGLIEREVRALIAVATRPPVTGRR